MAALLSYLSLAGTPGSITPTPVPSLSSPAFQSTIGAVFHVQFREDNGATFNYQYQVNIALALIQTNFAFSEYDLQHSRSLSDISQQVFGSLAFVRDHSFNGSDRGCITGNATITCYDNSGQNMPQSTRNYVHELGHFVDKKLGGNVSGSGSLSDILDNGTLGISYRQGDEWIRNGYGFDPEKGWQQNPRYKNDGGTIQNYDSALDINLKEAIRVEMVAEESADMFLNWVYHVAYANVYPIDNEYGKVRWNYMDKNMRENWLRALGL